MTGGSGLPQQPDRIAEAPDCSDLDPCVAECVDAEDHLQLSQFALDHVFDGVIWMSQSGQIIYANDVACYLLNRPREEILNRSLRDFLVSKPHHSWREHWGQLQRKNREISRCEVKLTNGNTLPVEISDHFLHFRGREYDCCFLRDVSDQKLVEDQFLSLKKELEAQVADRTSALREEIEGREGIEAALLDETEKIQTILDNAGQGFMTFGADLLIDVQYSEECRKIFGREVWGIPFPEVICPNDDENRGFLSDLLADVFAEQDPMRQSVFFSLLPAEILVNGRYISLEYRNLKGAHYDHDRRLMAVLTDVTETRQLQSQLEQDRQRLKMVVKAVTNYNDLAEAVRDYQLFCGAGMGQIIDSDQSVAGVIGEILRRIHTFKGVFAQLDLINVVKQLHEMETRVAAMRSATDPISRAQLTAMLDTSAMRRWLESDMQVLTDILGVEFFSREEKLEISSNELAEIEQAMISLLSPAENRQILPRLKHLRYRSFRHMLAPYADLVQRLAERLQKSIEPMAIEGDDVRVDPDTYGSFVKALVHVFRNIVDHGIEHDDERVARDKDPSGKVFCRVTRRGDFLELEIGDDGGGVDVDALRRRVVDAGLMSPETVERLSCQEALDMIFLDGISTTRRTTDLSGRGVGLAAVRQELNQLGGTVAVTTARDRGTTFLFTLPLSERVSFPKVSVEKIMRQIVARAREFITNEMGIGIAADHPIDVATCERVHAEEVAAIISIKGALSGLFSMSFDRGLARELVNRFAMDELTDEEVEDYVDDTMAEIANIVLGNTLNVFPEVNNLVTIGSPMTIRQDTPHVATYSGSEIWTCFTETDDGRFTLSMLVSETS